MRKVIYIFIFIGFISAKAQHKKILYGFDKIPQNLMLNPGSETTFKYHIGLPLGSAFSAHSNSSGITIADIFRDDSKSIFSGTDFNIKLSKAIDKLENDDYAYLNTQIEILNGGYKLNSRDYLSGGFYLETDIFTTLPKNILKLATEGNKNLINKDIDLKNVSVQAETLGVFHVGLSRRINDRFTLGGRLKIYFGGTNFSSVRNIGTLRFANNNKHSVLLKNLDVQVKSSRVYNEDGNLEFEAKKPFKGTFFGGNYGLGADLGFTYHINEQLEVTGSILDFGFINYAKDVRKSSSKGSHVFTGADIDFNSPLVDYWSKVKDAFEQDIKTTKNTDSYTVTRPMKAYLAYAYSFGKSLNRANCHDNTYKDFFDNTVGGQLFAVSQPNGLNFAYTAFYQRKLSKYLNLKATYTVDDFSYSNIGLGMSFNIWRINLYGSIGNILGITDTADTNTSSVQIGLNYIVN